MLDSPKKRGRPADPMLAQQRREEILAEATRLFGAKGFAATDIQEVASNLGLGKGTIYRYFPSKRHLFLAAADRGMGLLQAAVDAAVVASVHPLGQIDAGIRAYLRFFDEHPDIVELIMQERAEFHERESPTYFRNKEQNAQRWRELMQRLIADGHLRAIEPQAVLDFVGDLLFGMVFTNYFTGRKRALAPEADRVLDILYHGILGASRKETEA